jgi:hydroxymethylpyrimidine/phosphomethylpyrimidine kinase
LSGRPAVLVIAGSDSSGGAGLARDLKVLADFRCEALCAISAVTAQTHGHLLGVHHVPAQMMRMQVRAALASSAVAAIKIGMLGRRATVSAVADCLARGAGVPVVLDPVLRSSSGGELLDEAGRAHLRERLIPLATLLTPNIPEAASLCGAAPAADPEALLAQARTLLAMGARAVLLKGGHAHGPEATDLLLSAGGEPRWLTAPRLAARARGTGCALAAAIAASLAHGAALEEACDRGREYVLSMLSGSAYS